MKTVHSTIRSVCVWGVCGMLFWLGEMKWLNYTETTCNNPCIVKRTLITSDYSKHRHFNASQNIKLRARIDLLMMLWLLRWICSAVSWKCSEIYMWKQRNLQCWIYTIYKILPAADVAKYCYAFNVLLICL